MKQQNNSLIRDKEYWIRAIENYCDLGFLDAKKVWSLVSNYLINTVASSALACRVILNLDVPNLKNKEKEELKQILNNKINYEE